MISEDSVLSRLLHVEERSKIHEEKLEEHAAGIGKLMSMVHDLVVTVAVNAQQSNAMWKIIFAAIGILLAGLFSKFMGLI